MYSYYLSNNWQWLTDNLTGLRVDNWINVFRNSNIGTYLWITKRNWHAKESFFCPSYNGKLRTIHRGLLFVNVSQSSAMRSRLPILLLRIFLFCCNIGAKRTWSSLPVNICKTRGVNDALLTLHGDLWGCRGWENVEMIGWASGPLTHHRNAAKC